jgi:hypothetical protein
VRECARLLLDAGADPNSHTVRRRRPDAPRLRHLGLRNNHADDGDYVGTVAALVTAGAPTRLSPPTGDAAIDALLADPGGLR